MSNEDELAERRTGIVFQDNKGYEAPILFIITKNSEWSFIYRP